MLSVFAEWFKTLDGNGAVNHFQTFVVGRKINLRAMRTWVVLYGDPVFTNMQLIVYRTRNGEPTTPIAYADTFWTKEDLAAQPSACKEIYFEFLYAPQLNATETYVVALALNGYTGTEESHVAWVRAVPDPVNTGAEGTFEAIARAPFKVALIGEEL